MCWWLQCVVVSLLSESRGDVMNHGPLRKSTTFHRRPTCPPGQISDYYYNAVNLRYSHSTGTGKLPSHDATKPTHPCTSLTSECEPTFAMRNHGPCSQLPRIQQHSITCTVTPVHYSYFRAENQIRAKSTLNLLTPCLLPFSQSCFTLSTSSSAS
jgi:hypothetical protein